MIGTESMWQEFATMLIFARSLVLVELVEVPLPPLFRTLGTPLLIILLPIHTATS